MLLIQGFLSNNCFSENQEQGLVQFGTFVVKIYLKNWFECMLATNAPLNDLNLITDLKAYLLINPSIANAALEKFSNHYWYLSDILLGLSFFDSRIDHVTKIHMVAGLKRKSRNDDDLIRRKHLNSDEISDLVSSNTLRFFEIVGNNEIQFLETHRSS